MAIAQFARIVEDGVPFYVGDAAGPITAGVVFRVGIADEDATQRGITALVAELAALEGNDVAFSVGDLYTSFVATGPPDDVRSQLETVCRALADVDEQDLIDLADTVARDIPPPLTPIEDLVELRYGWQAWAIRGLPPLFAYAPDTARAHAWSARFFTTGNAVGWATGPLGGAGSFGLPDGVRGFEPETPEPLCTIPSWCAQDWIGNPFRDAIDLSTVVPTTDAQTVARVALATEVRERLADSPFRDRRFDLRAAGWGSLTHFSTTMPVASYGDVAVEAILGSIDDFIDLGPEADELVDAFTQLRTWAGDANNTAALGTTLAHDELWRGEERTLAALLDDLHAVSAPNVADAMRVLRDGLLFVVPAGYDITHPALEPFDAGWNEEVSGTTYYRAIDDGGPASDAELVVGPEGVTLTQEDAQLTTRFDECVAALEYADAAITLFAVDGTAIDVRADDWLDGESAFVELRRGLPADIILTSTLLSTMRAASAAEPNEPNEPNEPDEDDDQDDFDDVDARD